MPKEHSVVFFDLDGTVWDYTCAIPASAARAVQRLKANGHIPVICTGRAKGNVRDVRLPGLGFSGMIAACGAHIEYGGKVIREDLLPDETVRKIAELSVRYRVPVVLEGPELHWFSKEGFEHDGFVHRTTKALGKYAQWFSGYTPDMKINKFAGDIIAASDYASFKEALRGELVMIEHEIGMELGYSEASDKGDPNRIIRMFEGIAAGTSKGHGIRILCEYLGVDPADTYAIGDSNNDLEMIEAAGTGIAMGNGSAALKEAADYVTTDVHEDGLWNALEHFGLI